MKNKLYLSVFLMSIFVILVSPDPAISACSTEINNNDVCPPPSVSLPAAGEKFIDPTFGTEIIRVTDQNDGDDNKVAYAYWNLFNVDSTKFIVRSNDVDYLYHFNKDTDKITKVGILFSGMHFTWEGIIWSSIDPDVLFGIKGSRIYKYNVVTKQYTVIKDIDSIWSGTSMWQMSKDESDDVFAFTVKKGGRWLGCGAYRVSTDTGYRHDVSSMGECQIDKSGTWMSIKQSGFNGWHFMNIKTGEKKQIARDKVTHAPGHYDTGNGKIIGEDAWGAGLTIRSLSDPENWTTIYKLAWGQEGHVTWRNNDDKYAYYSVSREGGGTSGPRENEIIQVFLDGSLRWRRLAHHHTVLEGYYDLPFASVDRLGKYIMFASNWGSSSRRDIFILKIPSEAQAAPSAVNFPIRSNRQPTGSLSLGTSETTLSLATSQNATCRYSTTSGVSYASMTNTLSTGGVTHSETISGLQDGQNYTYYVKCQDSLGQTNANDFLISFSVASATTNTDTATPSNPVPEPAPASGNIAFTILKTNAPPTIDGDLSDFAGANSIVFAPASGGNSTTVKALWDVNALYLAYDVRDKQLSASGLIRDGGVWDDDAVEWFIDTQNDGSGFDRPSSRQMLSDDYQGIVNILNTQFDAQGTSTGSPSDQWNGPWKSAVRVKGTIGDTSDTDVGYTVEIKIPWSSLGNYSPPVEGTVMGMSFTLEDKDSASLFSYVMWKNATPPFQNASKWQKVLLQSGTTNPSTSPEGGSPAPPQGLEVAVQ